MRVQSTNYFSTTPAVSRSLPQAEKLSLPQDKLTLVEPPPPGYNPNTPMPGAQYIVGAVAAVAVGAAGAYAGLHTGLGATLAGVGAGAVTGAVGLGSLGLMADLGSMLSSKNYTKKAAMAGALLGGVGGGLVGALANHPVAAIALGGASALAGGLVATAYANEAFSG